MAGLTESGKSEFLADDLHDWDFPAQDDNTLFGELDEIIGRFKNLRIDALRLGAKVARAEVAKDFADEATWFFLLDDESIATVYLIGALDRGTDQPFEIKLNLAEMVRKHDADGWESKLELARAFRRMADDLEAR